MEKITAKQKLNMLLSRFSDSWEYRGILAVLKKLKEDKCNATIINNAYKLIEGIKVLESGMNLYYGISGSELNDILLGKNKREAFYQFIGRFYGKKAEQMLRDSGMGLEHIDSFRVFQKEFIEKLEKNNIKLKLVIVLKITDEETLDNYINLNKLKEMYREKPEIISVLEEIDIHERCTEMIENAQKVLLNKRVTENVNADALISIIKGDDNSYENICQLVSKTYGKEAEEILRERPKLTMQDIPNFDIFDENIQEMIGYGGVHTFLTYYTNSEMVITYIANNPDLVEYYKVFDQLTQDYFPPSAYGLEEKLITFYKSKDLIKQIVDSGRPNDFKEKLLLYIEDRRILPILTGKNRFENLFLGNKENRTFFPENDIKAETLEELEHYDETRDVMLTKYSNEKMCDKKDLMRFKYFGRLPDICNSKDMEKMLQDYVKLNQANLTNEELDLIELYLIFESITDEAVLESLDELLSQNPDVINPLHIRTICYKIAEDYKREYLESLFSVDDARKMADESEEILDSKSDSIQRNEASQNLTRRYILKKDDDNMYFSDHMRTPDGLKKYRDCTVEQNEETTTYTYIYKCPNGEEITKEVTIKKRADQN